MGKESDKIILNCLHCGKEFESRKSANRKFCSQECSQKSQKRKIFEKIEIVCLYCGKKFEVSNSRKEKAKFCCHSCCCNYYQFGQKKSKYDDILTKEFLREEYIKNHKTLKIISKEVGCNPRIIRNMLKKHNIAIIPHGEWMKGRKASEETKRKMRETAAKNKHLRLKGSLYKCEGCGKEYYVPDWKAKRTKPRFCSTECKEKYKLSLLDKNSPNFNLIICNCSNCEKEIFRTKYSLKDKIHIFCNAQCQKEFQRGINHPSFGKRDLKSSQRMIKNNPAKRLDVRKKMSLAAKRRGRQTHQDGRIFENYCCRECGNPISFRAALYGDGYCKKCAHSGNRNCNFGKTIIIKTCIYDKKWFKSSWEANFAKWCDGSGIKWEYEPKAFEVKLNKITHYTPDFYLPEFDCYIEIKGRWMNDAKEKINTFFIKYPNINLQIFEQKKLKELGVI